MAIRTYKDGRVKLTGSDYKMLRWAKYFKQDSKCAKCGEHVFFSMMELHHLKGRGMMGSKRDDTLKTTEGLCKTCHTKVTPKPEWSR